MENCVQLVLPASTVIVAQKVKKATAAGRPIYLYGNLMGGGASTTAIRNHLKAGYPVYATPLAAKTIFDDLERVAALGVRITEEPPPAGAVAIEMRDVDLNRLAAALAPYGIKLPERCAIAVQDHGESPPGESNRLFRFRHWRDFVERGGDIRWLIYREVPPYLTRMQAVKRDVPGAFLADTGAAAVWGALEDYQVAAHREEGVVIVNVGNQHTLGVLVKGWQIWGLFEHHTALMTSEKLRSLVDKLRSGELSHEEIYHDGGHGCYISSGYKLNGFRLIVVTGPRRAMARGLGYYEAAPHGNMMLAGCYGLVAALRATQNPNELK